MPPPPGYYVRSVLVNPLGETEVFLVLPGYVQYFVNFSSNKVKFTWLST